MYVFARKSVVEVQFVVFTTAGAPLHRQPVINWIFTQTKLFTVLTDESSYALMRHHVLLAIQTELKQAKFYYFSVAIDSGEIQASVWQE